MLFRSKLPLKPPTGTLNLRVAYSEPCHLVHAQRISAAPKSLLAAIPGVTCVKPTAALYMFPKLDPKVYPIEDDRQFFLDLLKETKVMLVQGTGFNWPTPDHFRIVFLPHEEDLREAVGRIAAFLERYRTRLA